MTGASKKTVLIIGGGAVGTIAALNLEAGQLATVTIVLRSNYDVVSNNGYHIESCDHGTVENWKPTHGKQAVSDHVEVPSAKLTSCFSSQLDTRYHRRESPTI